MAAVPCVWSWWTLKNIGGRLPPFRLSGTMSPRAGLTPAAPLIPSRCLGWVGGREGALRSAQREEKKDAQLKDVRGGEAKRGEACPGMKNCLLREKSHRRTPHSTSTFSPHPRTVDPSKCSGRREEDEDVGRTSEFPLLIQPHPHNHTQPQNGVAEDTVTRPCISSQPQNLSQPLLRACLD